ncbi:hypothetical protein BJ170DRAFT_630758 [Xylariales sp. AK1849]|nr:hypothetical protein BJ170DRAFT_630758 [Xylariales sp. AK1849]
MSTTSGQVTAVLAGSFLSGAMASIALVAVPVFLDTTTDGPLLTTQWARMYHYGHQVMPSMSVGTCLLYGYMTAKKRSAKRPWGTLAAAGATTVIMVPFTWFIMAPTNNQLFRLNALSKTDPSAVGLGEVKDLVVKWWWLHLARTIFPLVGAIIGSVAAFGVD